MQHVVSNWRYRLLGDLTTWCGQTDWQGGGEHDPLCGVCARKAGLQPGSRESPVLRPARGERESATRERT